MFPSLVESVICEVFNDCEVMTDLKFYEIDREGWVGINDSLVSKNDRLAWADVKEGEYIVIDSDGYLYEAREDPETRWGYRWKRTDRKNIDLKMVLANYAHNEQLTKSELNFCR